MKSEVPEMRNLLIYLTILAMAALCSCSESDDPVGSLDGPPAPDPEEVVIANAYIVQDAVEAFRAGTEHGGICPADIDTDTNSVGLTLVDYLPDGMLIENPYTGQRTEPVEGVASEPGQVGYSIKMWFPSYYAVTGFGEDSLAVILTNMEELENRVVANCFTVQQAVEEYARLNGGEYPANVGVDTTPWGDTVICLLLDGVLLENPLTCVATEPIDGAAVTPGQTAYAPYQNNLGINYGYQIIGGGVWGDVIFTCTRDTDGTISIDCHYSSYFRPLENLLP
jgi:hypothetical protein